MDLYLNSSVLKSISSPFGQRRDPISKAQRFHNGVDIKATIGTCIRAPFAGKVMSNKTTKGGFQSFLTSYGNPKLVIGLAHLSSMPTVTSVKAGDAWAISGNSGQTTGPHIHVTCRVADRLVDPQRVLPLFD